MAVLPLMAKRIKTAERSFDLAYLSKSAPNVLLFELEKASWEQSRLLALFLKDDRPEPDAIKDFHLALIATRKICEEIAGEGITPSTMENLVNLGHTISMMFVYAPDEVPETFTHTASLALGLKHTPETGISRCTAIFQAWAEKCERVAHQLLHPPI